MNKQRRAALNKLQDRLTALNLADAISELLDIASELEAIRDEEQDAYDNLPDSLRDGEKGQDMDTAIGHMTDALEPLQEFADGFPLDEIFAGIEEAKGQA